MTLQQPGCLEDAVDAGGATGHDVLVEHHEGQAAVALQGEAFVEVDDGLLLLGRRASESRGIQALCSLALP